jgi:hypothetical protein
MSFKRGPDSGFFVRRPTLLHIHHRIDHKKVPLVGIQNLAKQ